MRSSLGTGSVLVSLCIPSTMHSAWHTGGAPQMFNACMNKCREKYADWPFWPKVFIVIPQKMAVSKS